MGHLPEKYTKEYFLHQKNNGKPLAFGVNGIEEYLRGDIRVFDKDILCRINFKNARVLDIGFGRGEAIKYAANHGAFEIDGVDFSKSAFEIAEKFLNKYKIKAKLYCDDALEFLNRQASKKVNPYDVVLMLDVVEHIPRDEFGKILASLSMIIKPFTILAINTPVFKVDNDVFKDGLNKIGWEDSDDYNETSGMHVNRFTKKSLNNFLFRFHFVALSNHIYIYGLNFPKIINGTILLKLIFRKYLTRINKSKLFRPELFEYAFSRKAKREAELKQSKNIVYLIKKIINAIVYYSRFENFRKLLRD